MNLGYRLRKKMYIYLGLISVISMVAVVGLGSVGYANAVNSDETQNGKEDIEAKKSAYILWREMQRDLKTNTEAIKSIYKGPTSDTQAEKTVNKGPTTSDTQAEKSVNKGPTTSDTQAEKSVNKGPTTSDTQAEKSVNKGPDRPASKSPETRSSINDMCKPCFQAMNLHEIREISNVELCSTLDHMTIKESSFRAFMAQDNIEKSLVDALIKCLIERGIDFV
jgi:hypothetical protein